MGAIPKGAAAVPPNSGTANDLLLTSRRIRGWSVSVSRAARLRAAPVSALAAPSI